MIAELTEQEKAKLTPEELVKHEAEVKLEVEQKIKDEAEEAIKKEAAEKLAAEEAKKAVDPLAVGVKFKKVGDFVVAADFDPTLAPEYKKLNDQFVSAITKAKEDGETLTKTVDELKVKLTDKKDLDEAEKKKISDKLSEVEIAITVATKDSEAAKMDLLKMQTALSLGLPYNFVSYIKGKTAEEITASVQKVMEDFKLQETKFSKEELELQVKTAAEKAKKDTEEALKARGNPTEGIDHEDHVFTRLEIRTMSVDEFKIHREKIKKQEEQGLIK